MIFFVHQMISISGRLLGNSPEDRLEEGMRRDKSDMGSKACLKILNLGRQKYFNQELSSNIVQTKQKTPAKEVVSQIQRKQIARMLPLYGKESWIPDHETHNWSLQFLVNREANNSDQKEFFLLYK